MKAGTRTLDSGIFVGLLLAALTLAVYLPVRHHGFLLFDDAEYVTDNPMVQAGLTPAGVKWAFTHFHSANWHPLTWITHMLDVQIFGSRAGGPHLVNVFFHAANAVLIFALLRRLTGAFWRSACVAALFALHPLRVESVAWITERKDVLSGFFFLLTLCAYTRYVAALRERKPNARTWYGGTLLLFASGLMSKPMLVTLPFVLLLLDYWPLERVQEQLRVDAAEGLVRFRLVWEKIPFLALSAVSCAVTFAAQRHDDAVGSLARFPISARVANALVACARYLEKTFWPSQLAAFYPHPGHWPPGTVLFATILITALGLAMFWLGRRAPFVVTGGLWFFGMLVPTIGLVQVSDQAMADRYTYLPSIGLFVVVVWGIAGLAQRRGWPKLAVGCVAGAALLACAVAANRQVRHWRDSETLFRHALAVTRNNFVAHYNLANALVEKGRVDEAISEFEQALAICPDYADAHCNLGGALLRQGRTDDAIARFRKALVLQPHHGPARCNLGLVLLQQGNVEGAADEFGTAIDANAENVTAHFLLGNVLFQQGRVDAAIARYEKVLGLRADHADAHNNLAAALLQQNRVDDALVHLQRALAVQPGHVNANAALADVLMQRGLPEFAIVRYQKVLAVQPGNAGAHFNLGTAALLIGRTDEAIEHFQKTLELRPGFAPAHNNLGFVLIQQGRPREAIVHLQTAAELQPDNARTLAGLAWVLATSPDASARNGARAIQLAGQANQLSGNQDPEILRSLAAAYAEGGRFTDAVQAAQRGLTLAEGRPDPTAADALRVQLKRYESGAPFRDSGETKEP